MRFAVLALIALCCGVARADHTMNPLVGDASWIGHTEPDGEVARVRAHLAFARDVLARRDVSSLSLAQRTARAAGLATLQRYLERGVFPRRTDDAYDGRRPRFIDERGVHCAVGQLIADSGYEDLARAVNARYEYAHVREMESPALVAWAAEHGFTVDELAMIQPTYRGAPTPEGARRKIDDAKRSMFLHCARTHVPASRLSITVRGDKGGRMDVSTKSADAFARCFVEKASQLERGGGAYKRQPSAFSFDMDLSFPTAQALLEQQLATWMPDCSPRPGAIAREAVVDITSDQEALVVRATTIPSNPLVDSCLEEEGERAFVWFGPGAWKLHASKRIAVPPRVRLSKDNFAFDASSAATDCNPNPEPNAASTITMSAKTGDRRFRFTATGTADFAACVGEKLNRRLTERFTTTYWNGDKRVQLFRIDAEIVLSVTIQLESAAARMKRLEGGHRRKGPR